ncbi:MAG: hypothetical protein ACE5ES_00595, partial [Candidatus Nanoarchaeia archaeon]
EVETQSCTVSSTGGSGGGSCSDECSLLGNVQSICSDEFTIGTRTCGNFDADNCLDWSGLALNPCSTGEVCDDVLVQCVPEISFIPICTPNWQCSDWGECFLGESTSSLKGIGTGNVISDLTSKGFIELTGDATKSKEDKKDKEKDEEEKEDKKIKIKKPDKIVKGKSTVIDVVVDFFSFKGRCEDVGQRICHPKKLRRYRECVEKKNRKGLKLVWKTKTYPKGLMCFEDGAACSIVNSCEVEDATRCTKLRRAQVCVEDSNGCLTWTNSERCGRGEVCSEGTCIEGKPLDSNVCSLEDETCIGKRPYICEQNNRGIDLWTLQSKVGIDLWNKADRCDRTETCFEGQCLSNNCFNGVQDIGEEGIDCGGVCTISCIIEEPPISEVNETGSVSEINKTEEPLLNPVDIQKRTCTDLNSCGSDFGKPEAVRLCLACTPNWECGEWSGPLYGTEERLCTDLNGCEVDKVESRPATCREEWACSWNDCQDIGNGTYYATPYNCVEINNCGTESDMPGPIQCVGGSENKPFSESPSCLPTWEFGEWEECTGDYTIREVIEGRSQFPGTYERNLTDISGCGFGKKVQVGGCNLSVPIIAERTQWCFEEYIKVYNTDNGELVSIVKETGLQNTPDLNKVDIHFIDDESIVCGYCFDGVQNFDETGIDCGGSSCPKCLRLSPFEFFDWLFWLIIILWIIVLILMTWIYKEEKKRKPVSEKGKLKRWFKSLVSRVKLKETREEKLLEKKIIEWFRRVLLGIVNLPRRIFTLPWKVNIKKRKPHVVLPVPVIVKERPKKKYFVAKAIERHRRKREVKNLRRIVERKVKRRNKLERKYEKKKVRRIKNDIRKRKIAGLIRKLRIWKKEGYYGTAELEREIKKLKEKK